MKKIGLLFALFVAGVSLVFADIFITELADPNNQDGARYVEIYNSGASAVDLSTGYDLIRWTNDNTDPTLSSIIELSGTIASGGFYVVCNNQTTFTATYGSAADQNGGTGGPADSNGDDQIALRNPSDEIIDMFGVVGEDGSGTNHEFENGRAERKATVTSGNTTYTFAEWNIWNDTGGSGTTNDPQDAPADFDPGEWIGTGVSANSASAIEVFGLYQNYPNPFNSSTTISFNLATNSHENTQIEIYNIKGQLVKEWEISSDEFGVNQVVWNVENQSSGIYFYKLKVNGRYQSTQKMILLK